MKATADAVQVQAQNSITLAQIWEPQMQHHELQKCRTEHHTEQKGDGLCCLNPSGQESNDDTTRTGGQTTGSL